jgi:hypothetical protein
METTVMDARGLRAARVDGGGPGLRARTRPKPALWISGLMLLLAAATAAGVGPKAVPDPPAPPRPEPSPELPRPYFVVRYTPGADFLVLPQEQEQPLVDINSVALRVYDRSNNWLRIEASAGQSGTHTPKDANQVFSSIFDASTNAVHVTCLSGCGAVFGSDLSAVDSSHQKVVGFGGIPLSATPPAGGDIYQYNAAQNQWVPGNSSNFLGNGNQNEYLGWTGNTWGPMPVSFTNVAGVATSGQLPPASSSAIGGLQLTGDIGGQAAAPWVLGTHLSSPLSIAQGGTGLASGGTTGQCLIAAGSINTWTYCLQNPLNTTIHVDGKAFTSVAQAEGSLPAGSAATIYDDICGDTFAADPFNASNPIYLRLVLARCSQPYVLNVPVKVGTLQQLIGSGPGLSGSAVAGTVLKMGSAFPPPVASAPPAPAPSATTAGCTAYPAGGTYYAKLTYVNAAGETLPSVESAGVTLNGTSQCLLIASPASATGATGYRVYAANASGAEVYQGTANIGQSVTLSSVTTAGNAPSGINSTGALITLGSTVPGSASSALGARVENLSIDCNGGAQSVAIYNALGQDGSGAFRVDAQDCAGTAAFVAEGYNGGTGANNSAFEHVSVTDAKDFNCGSGTSPCNPTYCVLVDGVSSLRHVENLNCTPNSGVTVAGVEVRGASPASGPGSQGAAVRDVHCEGQAGTFNYCVEGIGAQLAVEHLTTSSGTLNSVHLDPTSFDSTVADILPYSGSHYALVDSINGYTSPAGQRIGFYAVGSSIGQLLSNDATFTAGKIYASPATGTGPLTYRALASADLGLSAPGDLLTVNTSGSLTRLAEGSNNQCLGVSAGALAWTSSCGAAGGSSLQLQANNGGALAGVPGTGVNLTTGALSLQPASGQDAVPLTLAPSITSPTADFFDVYKDPGKTSKTFWVDSSGNPNFAGNGITLGATGQSTVSTFTLYGSTGNSNTGPPYIKLCDETGAYCSYLQPGTSSAAAGEFGIANSIPTGDISAANVVCTHGNGQCGGSFASPMTTAGDMIYETSAPAPARLGIGATGQCLTVSGGLPTWGSCSSTGGSVSSVGTSAPLTGGPITGAGTIGVNVATTYLSGPAGTAASTSATAGHTYAYGFTVTWPVTFDHFYIGVQTADTNTGSDTCPTIAGGASAGSRDCYDVGIANGDSQNGVVTAGTLVADMGPVQLSASGEFKVAIRQSSAVTLMPGRYLFLITGDNTTGKFYTGSTNSVNWADNQDENQITTAGQLVSITTVAGDNWTVGPTPFFALYCGHGDAGCPN